MEKEFKQILDKIEDIETMVRDLDLPVELDDYVDDMDNLIQEFHDLTVSCQESWEDINYSENDDYVDQHRLRLEDVV